MCGIMAVLNIDQTTSLEHELNVHLESLKERGPDGVGFHADGPVWMGHTRLAIIDLSPEAEQPFLATSQQQVITFNGEIYNHEELRNELSLTGYEFRTKSDTEVILAIYEKFGTDGFCKLRGMFAFVIFDKNQAKLVVARDRFGEKPLYVTTSANKLIFSSQLSTNFDASLTTELELNAILDYFYYQFTGPNHTVLKNCKKFKQNTVETYNLLGNLLDSQEIFKEDEISQGLMKEPLVGHLEKAVRRNLVADVPVCIAQSGGIDSVAVAILASRNTSSPINSFTVGYEGAYDFDERPWAKKLSKFLGNVQHDIQISEKDFVLDFEEYVSSLQDPIADPAGYAQFRLAKEIHGKGFKVCLTGLGADELFWGYPWLTKALNENGVHIERIKNAGAKTNYLSKAEGFAYKIYKNKLDIVREWPHKVDKANLYFYSGMQEFNAAFSLVDKYLNIPLNQMHNPFSMTGFRVDNINLVSNQIQNTLFDTWLACNSLSLIDQVSMFHSVEFRSPFLDVDLAEYALENTGNNLDLSLNKALLKKELATFVPEEFLKRPKSGFNFPANIWFRSLLDQKGEVLLNGTLSQLGLLSNSAVEKSLSSLRGSSWQEVNFLYKVLLLDTYLRRFDVNG
jgi:asparagine synthase (glutamine-hydrolysing)